MASKGYTTKLAIEDYLLITIDNSFNDQIDEWISGVEAYIEQVTGRVFIAPEEATLRRFDGDGTNELQVDDMVEVTQVKVDDTVYEADESGDGTDDDYLLYPANTLPKNVVLLETAAFTRGKQNVRITARWGYSEEVPADVKFAATVLAAGIVNFSNDSEGEVQSMTIGRYSVTYKTDQEKKDYVKAGEILATYKRIATF